MRIYSNHFDHVNTQLARALRALPVMKIDPTVSDLFAFRFDDSTLEGYEAEPSIAAPIARCDVLGVNRALSRQRQFHTNPALSLNGPLPAQIPVS